MKRFGRIKAGFTLAETLLAMMLLLIASSLLAAGLPVAFNAYKKVTLSADANVLISTTMTELRDKLAFSDDIEISDKTITFTSGAGREYSLSYNADEGGLFLKDLTAAEYSPDPKGDSRLLVSDAAAAKELYAYFNEVQKNSDGTILQFIGLGIYRKSDDKQKNPLITIEEFDVRLIKNEK